MSDSPDPLVEPHSSTCKRKRSKQGCAARKARDAHQQVEHYEGRKALASPSYTPGMVDDLQLQVHLTPPVPGPLDASSAVKVRRGVLRAVRVARRKPPSQVASSSTRPHQRQQAAGGPLGLRPVAHPARGHEGPKPFLGVTAPTMPLRSTGSSCAARLASSTKFVTSSSKLRQCRRRQLSPVEHIGLHIDLDSSRKIRRLLTSQISARVLRPGTSLAANLFLVGGRLGGTSLLRTGSQSGMA